MSSSLDPPSPMGTLEVHRPNSARLGTALIQDGEAPDPSAMVMVDVVYHEVDGHGLTLDVSIPEGPSLFPMGVIVYTVGFSSGDKREGTARVWGEYPPTIGFASVSVNDSGRAGSVLYKFPRLNGRRGWTDRECHFTVSV